MASLNSDHSSLFLFFFLPNNFIHIEEFDSVQVIAKLLLSKSQLPANFSLVLYQIPHELQRVSHSLSQRNCLHITACTLQQRQIILCIFHTFVQPVLFYIPERTWWQVMLLNGNTNKPHQLMFDCVCALLYLFL